MNIITFFVTAIGLGFGLAMDAVSVSLADIVREPGMTKGKKASIALAFGVFQFAMPLIGWVLVSEAVKMMGWLMKLTPWISLILLLILGIRMIREDDHSDEETTDKSIGWGEILTQGVATSIDALSVGFTIASYTLSMALTASAVIGVVTMGLCMAALYAGTLLKGRLPVRETVLGGVILILIGIKVFIDGVF